MCGLFGLICKPQGMIGSLAKKRFLQDAMYISAMRGWDATGLAVVRDPMISPIVFKKAMQAPDFIQLKTTQRLLTVSETAKAVLGHTRSSTRGGADQDECAHPFQFGHITLIHNGTVNGLHHYSKGCEINVDSAELAYAFEKHGDEKEVLEEITGDYCIVWHNAKQGTINIARNEHKPLYWAEVPEWNGFAFMSEHSALAMLLERNNIKIHKNGYFYPKPHNIYSWKFTDTGIVESMLPFEHGASRARGSPRTISHRGKPSTGELMRWVNRPGDRTSTGGDGLLGEMETTKDGVFQPEAAAAFRRNSAIVDRNDNKNSCRPTSNKQISKVEAKLKAVGYKYNELLGATPRLFVPYKNQRDFGCIYLRINGNHKEDKAEIHNVPRAVFKAITTTQDFIHGRAVNLRTENKNKVVILEMDQKQVAFIMNEFDEERELIEGYKIAKQAWEDVDYEIEERGDTIKMVMGPEGEMITEDEFTYLTTKGCSYCSNPLDASQHKEIMWIGVDYPICPDCKEDTEATLAVKQVAALSLN